MYAVKNKEITTAHLKTISALLKIIQTPAASKQLRKLVQQYRLPAWGAWGESGGAVPLYTATATFILPSVSCWGHLPPALMAATLIPGPMAAAAKIMIVPPYASHGPGELVTRGGDTPLWRGPGGKATTASRIGSIR